MKNLSISKELSLPLDTVTSTLIVYGGKGMGKTVFGAVLAEELAAARQRWAWLDPLGVGWGIRHSADGDGKGVECLILGGARGDIPIEPTSGAAVADVVVEERGNVLVDFSRKPSGEMWGVGEKIRFVTAYARRLFQRQGELVGGRRREPLFQILDEGARYIPQTIPAGNQDLAMCVSVWQQFVEEGRNVGLGLCVLTQRSARISKDVAELADAMVAFRTIGPNSLGAVLDWLGEHVERSRVKDLSAQVRELPRGSALIVSPGWLKLERVVPIRMRSTFDSSATPKAGERPRSARGEGAKPDLDKIRARMAETIERAKADDPRTLRARIAELEKQAMKKVAEPTTKVVEKEVPVVSDAMAKRLEKSLDALKENTEMMLGAIDTLKTAIAPIRFPVKATPPTGFVAPLKPPQAAGATPRLKETNGASKIGAGGLRRIMIALAQRPGLTNRQIGIRAGLSSSSGTFSTYLSKAKTEGWITYDGERRFITHEGLQVLGAYTPLPTGTELLEHWLDELGTGGTARILRAVAAAYPMSLTNEEICFAANMTQSGTFSTYMSRLRTLELIVGARGEPVRLSEELVG